MRLALTVSIGLHAALLAALVWLTNAFPPPIEAPAQKRFEIALNQPAAPPEPVEAVQPPPEPVPPVPPEPERPIAAPEVPPAPLPEVPAVTATEPPPPPPPKPVVKPKPPPPKPVVRRSEPPPPQIADLPPPVPAPVYAPAPIPAPAAVPAAPAPPRPDLANSYRAMLSGWFESHKRYPNSARENAEQGSAIVHFRVDAAGRILDYGLSKSTGYPDLDNGIAEMMRGAQLPPFPPGLTLSYLDVAVTLRFSLTR